MRNTKKEPCNIYRVSHLMGILGIGRDKAYALMRSDAFPSIKLGGNYIVSKDKFEDWLNNNSFKKYKL